MIRNATELRAAIAADGTAPGSTVLVAAGTYAGDFTSAVVGTVEQPIRFVAAGRVIIDGALTINGAYTIWEDIEVTSTIWTTRVTAESGGSPTAFPPSGLTVNAAHTTLIAPTVHDTRDGFAAWGPAADMLMDGGLIYNNGWQGADRGHGHGVYSQNNTGAKTYKNTVVLTNYSSYGYHIYGEAGQLNGFIFDGPITTAHFLVGGGQPVEDLVVRDGIFLGGNPGIGNGNPDNGSATITGNVFAVLATIDGFQALTVTDNLWHQQDFSIRLTRPVGHTTTIDRNTYLVPSASAPSQFRIDGTDMDFAAWQAAGYDAHGSVTYESAGSAAVSVRAIASGRRVGVIVIRNPSDAPAADVDLSSLGLRPGATYRLVNAQNYYGDTPFTFTYDGGAVTVPMTGWTVAVPTAGDAALETSLFPQYGVFVLERSLQGAAMSHPLLPAARAVARFGVGGPSWAVTAPASGLGGAPTSAGTVTGKAVQGQLGRQGIAAPGTPVEPLKWYFVATTGDTLSAKQQITDGTYTFTVVGIAAVGLDTYELERV